MKILTKIKETFYEQAKKSYEYLRNQISAIDAMPNTPRFMKEIYKGDVISRELEWRALFADY